MAAAPEVVWDLLADITRVPEWSPECVRTAWLGDGRFTGRNRAANGFEWSVTCRVTESERPRAFGWDVLSDEQVSSSWRCELSPVPDGTRVRESFTHGPGDSWLRWLAARTPDRADAIVAGRRRQLAENISRSLAGLRVVAERQT